MKFDNCYVAEDRNGGYLAIRDSNHEDVVTYVALDELGDFEQFLADAGGDFQNVTGAKMKGEAKIFAVTIGAANKVYDTKEGRKRRRFDIPMNDILKLKIA